jgi:type I restriction enzyme M protein
LKGVPLVNPYSIYQILSDQWPTIVNDIEVIQTEGFDAVRTVEPAMKLVKDGDDEKEVPDGMKGRILPFEMVQRFAFMDEMLEISHKEEKLEGIAGELEEIQESFTEDEAQEYIEGDDKPKLDKAKIKKDAKAKGDDIEPDTKEKLKKMVGLWDLQLKLGKELKAERQALTDKTIEAIQNLDDDEIMEYLDIKWIQPVTTKIFETPDKEIESLNQQVYALAKKYATPYHDLNAQLTEAQDELAGLISQLEGDESSIAGLNALMDSFKD